MNTLYNCKLYAEEQLDRFMVAHKLIYSTAHANGYIFIAKRVCEALPDIAPVTLHYEQYKDIPIQST